MENKDFKSILRECKIRLAQNPDDGHLYLKLARLYRKMRDYESAIEGLKEAERRGVSPAWFHLELGRVHRDKDSLGLAKKEFQMALSLDSQCGEIHAELAWVYIKEKEYGLAIKELSEALKKGFNEEHAREALDTIHRRQKVIEEFNRAILSEPEDIDPSGCITEYVFQEGYKSFVERLKDIAGSNPNCLRPHIELIWIYTWHKQYDSAFEELRRISEITPQDKKIHTDLAKIYNSKKDYKTTVEELEKVLKIKPGFNNQSDGLNRESIETLIGLFPGRTQEIEDLIESLSKANNLYNWRYPGIHRLDGELLYLITRLLKPEVIIEAGTWMGSSTAYLAKGCYDNKIGKVITVDNRVDVGYAIPDELVPIIEFHKGVDILDVLPVICSKEPEINMFFHDSNDSYELLQWELDKALPFISKGGLIVAHDALNHTNCGMGLIDFFKEIKNSVECYFFNTAFGLGVIKDVEGLRSLFEVKFIE